MGKPRKKQKQVSLYLRNIHGMIQIYRTQQYVCYSYARCLQYVRATPRPRKMTYGFSYMLNKANAQSQLGWEPTTPIEESLALTLKLDVVILWWVPKKKSTCADNKQMELQSPRGDDSAPFPENITFHTTWKPNKDDLKKHLRQGNGAFPVIERAVRGRALR